MPDLAELTVRTLRAAMRAMTSIYDPELRAQIEQAHAARDWEVTAHVDRATALAAHRPRTFDAFVILLDDPSSAVEHDTAGALENHQGSDS